MGWLDDRLFDYLYKCPEGHETVERTKDTRDKIEESVACGDPDCNCVAHYVKVLPDTRTPVGKVSFEQNGRLAYRYASGAVISATKYHYLQTGRVERQLSGSFIEHEGKDGLQNLDPDVNMRRASARFLREKEYKE